MFRTGPSAAQWIAGLFLAALFLCPPLVEAAPKDVAKPWAKVEDPHLGEVLFYFYQQKYFSSLTHLLSAEQLQRVAHSSGEAELLRGGLYLSYGLHTEAARIFQRLIDQGAAPQVRDRAWFFIAKIRYQRGYTDEAEDALTRVRDTLPDDLEEERKVLLAYLLMAKNKYPEAIQILRGLRGQTGIAAYGRYNLGVALIKSGNKQAGIDFLGAVGYMHASDEEMRALRDKANLALGYYFLQEGAPSMSKAYLNEVRVDGPLSNMALLGVGWGYSAEGKHEQSLAPWIELQQRDSMDTAVQESLLAVPYAFAQLGAYKQALHYYQGAIATYEQELVRLDGSIQSIRAGKLSENILRHDPGDEMGWFWKMDKLPDAPESRYLIQLLSSNEFQEAFKNYRDLRFLQSNLNTWSENIGVFNDVLTTRRTAYNQRLPGVLDALRRTSLVPQIEGRNRYAEKLTEIETTQDSFALASNEQKQQLVRLARVKARLKTLSGKEDVAAQQDKYALLSGVLSWNIASDYVPHLWEAKKALRELDAEIAQAGQRKQSLAQAQANAVKAFEGYDGRISGLRERIGKLLARATLVAGTQEQYLEQMAIAELEQHKQRLGAYLVQARFAVAQIYDQAARAENAEKTATQQGGAVRAGAPQ